MVLNKITTAFLFYFCCTVECASILALFSTLSYSDHLVFNSYVYLLAQKGHSVVVMTPYPSQYAYPDVNNVVGLNVGQESSFYWEEYKSLMTNNDDYYLHMRAINDLSLKLAVRQLTSKPMTALLINPNVKFDLVITEADVPLLYAVAEKYKAPHIAITASSGKIHQYESKGAPIQPLLYPDVNSLNYRNLSRWHEIVELNRHYKTRQEYYKTYLPLCEVAAKKILGLKRNLQEVEYDIDLLFVANNPALIGNRPSSNAIVYVDRMHIRPDYTLPEDLKATLDSATKGAIYFSLGALQEPEHLAPQLLQTLADAFRELPYLVVWKIANTTMINKPNNVISSVWFPQQEVLAHPNVKVFITNGGGRSLEEAVYYEVPILGLPIVKSRKVFIQEITRHGGGEVLDPYYLEKEELKQTISSIVSNDTYQSAISKLKITVYDPVLSNPDNALWWTEYLLEVGNAKHLRSPTVGLSFFKYYVLDIVIVLLTVSVISFLLLFYILRCVLRRLRRRFSRRFEDAGKFKAL